MGLLCTAYYIWTHEGAITVFLSHMTCTTKKNVISSIRWHSLYTVILINPQAHFDYAMTNIFRKRKLKWISTRIAHTSQSMSVPQMSAKLNKPNFIQNFLKFLGRWALRHQYKVIWKSQSELAPSKHPAGCWTRSQTHSALTCFRH